MSIKRRAFITLLGGAAAWPLAARAQQGAKLPTVGFLDSSSPSTQGNRLAPFVQRLRELGWIEGRTVALEARWAEGRNERSAEIAAELVRLKVDVIVAAGAPNTEAAKQVTSVIPIVSVSTADPVAIGLVASLARPGGNVTGLSNQNKDIAGKRVELLRAVVPDLRRLAIMANVGAAGAALELREFQAAARTLGLEAVPLEIRRVEDIGPAMEALKSRADALSVVLDGLTLSNRARINILALGAQVPTMLDNRELLDSAGLMSYGAITPDLFRRAGDYVDKILRGTKPADIPVEQPTKFELVVNLITAKALGLTIPSGVLATANEVIE
jgi:putative ABC transport system substrate-binding protein